MAADAAADLAFLAGNARRSVSDLRRAVAAVPAAAAVLGDERREGREEFIGERVSLNS